MMEFPGLAKVGCSKPTQTRPGHGVAIALGRVADKGLKYESDSGLAAGGQRPEG